MTPTRTPWTVTALMALGSFVAMFALTTLIQGTGWLRTVFVVLLVTAGADIAVRASSRSRFLPTAAAFSAAVVVMVPLFAVDELGEKRLLPTPSALGDLWQAFVDGAEYAANTAAPAPATTPLIALLTAFAVAIFLVADHLAASWRAVAVSGVVLILPWTPAIFLQYRVPLWALFATAACWMLAMAAARSSLAAHRTAPASGALIATGAALLATLLVVPSALGGNGWGMIPRLNAPSQLDTATRLNLALDLRNSLTVNSTNEVLSYTSTGAHPDTLRLYTYVDFDGSSWERPRANPDANQPVAGQLLWPSQLTSWEGADPVTLAIDVQGASERNLPIPTAPRSVDIGGGWLYSPDWDEVTTEGSGTRGVRYTVLTDLDFVTEEALEESQRRIDNGEGQLTSEYTAVPSSVDLARITALAQDLTAESTSRREQAVALQDYLRSSANFTYDTSVSPGGGGDSVSQFLDDRRGYCVHFATTMVMLARSLDIPARMAVGYLGGRLTDGARWQVIGGDAHAWPELYFPDQGWVRFEPTPSVQTGSPPTYADTNAGQSPSNPDNIPVPTTVPSAPAQTSAPLPTNNPVGTEPDSGVTWWVIVLAVVAVAGAVALGWVLRRRSAARAAAHGPEAAWTSLRERLPAPLRWPLTLTPHEAAEYVEEHIVMMGGGLTGAGSHALERLRDAVSDARYAPLGSEVEEEDLWSAVELVATEASGADDRSVAQKSP